MSNLSEQKIMVLCDFEESASDAVAHGLRIAGIFKKELCLFHPLGADGKGKRQQAQKKLEVMIGHLKHQAKGIPVSSLTLSGNLSDVIDRVTDDYDGIMLVLTTTNIAEKMSVLKQSQIPFLFVSGSSPEYLRYDRVILPVGTRKAIKNTSLWASYFSRFNHSDLSLLVAEEKSADQKNLIRKNMKFINELFLNLSLEFQLALSDKDSAHLTSEVLNNSFHETYNLMIIASGRQTMSADRFPGFADAKIVKQACPVPVLCINPNRDMYILCD